MTQNKQPKGGVLRQDEIAKAQNEINQGMTGSIGSSRSSGGSGGSGGSSG